MMADSSSSYGMTRSMTDDPFANFSYHPPKPVGRFRNFGGHRSRYKAMSVSREQLGSSSSLATLSGSSQNLLDPVKMMSMQEDAKSRKISSEVMKHCLYESVLSPSKRRFSMRPTEYCNMSVSEYGDDPDPRSYARMVQSLPVTPAQSQTVTPLHSPRTSRRFRAFFSCGLSPRNANPEEDDCSFEVEEDSWKGLPSLFRPRPRYIPASGVRPVSTNLDDMKEDAMEYVNSDSPMVLDAPPRVHQYRSNALS